MKTVIVGGTEKVCVVCDKPRIAHPVPAAASGMDAVCYGCFGPGARIVEVPEPDDA